MATALQAARVAAAAGNSSGYLAARSVYCGLARINRGWLTVGAQDAAIAPQTTTQVAGLL